MWTLDSMVQKLREPDWSGFHDLASEYEHHKACLNEMEVVIQQIIWDKALNEGVVADAVHLANHLKLYDTAMYQLVCARALSAKSQGLKEQIANYRTAAGG